MDQVPAEFLRIAPGSESQKNPFQTFISMAARTQMGFCLAMIHLRVFYRCTEVGDSFCLYTPP